MTPFALFHLLENSARQYPERVAVEDQKRSATYGELDGWATRLARGLREGGVGRGDRVGFLLPKSLEAVVSAFGIMKAGAAYVPLDSAAPATRLAYIVRNCGMRGLVTSRRLWEQIAGELDADTLSVVVLTDAHETAPGRDGLRVVGWEEVAATADEPVPNDSLTEQDLAYILYTSGSTGDPKGVMLSHRAALTFVNWAGDLVGVSPDDRLSQHAPMHFDLSIFDLYAGIRAGATVVLVPKSLSVFPRNLADFIEERGITVWYSVPSILTKLLLHGGLERHGLRSLRTVIFAGEVFPTKYLRGLMESVPHPEYLNWYGPTESNVCTWYRVPTLDPDRDDAIPIGRACGNTDVFAITPEGRLAGVDEEGELYVRSPSLMDGYWGDPERTTRTLVRHPLRPELARDVLRTGDLVRLGADGDYRFLGRRDNMIKSRGYRIELGEIETALYAHGSVREAAVVAIPDDEVGNLIKAVVVVTDPDIRASDLEYHCSQRIPRYMIPGAFEFRESLPKTSTGKVDRPTLVREHREGAPSRA